MMRSCPIRKPHGFTLLELAVVLVVIGLLAGGGLIMVNALLAQEKRDENAEYMEEVRQALLAYAQANSVVLGQARLPLADKNGDGVSETNTADPANLKGDIPYKTLGVKPYDAWGRRLAYEVNAGLVTINTTTTCNTLRGVINGTASLDSWKPKVWDSDAGASPANPFAVGVIAVSAGSRNADGSGGVYDAVYSAGPPASGGDNESGNPYLRRRPDAIFDDMVVYIGANTLFDWMRCP